MKCIMDGETIYLTHPILDESDPHAKTLIAANDGDARLTGGSIRFIREPPSGIPKVELKPCPTTDDARIPEWLSAWWRKKPCVTL